MEIKYIERSTESNRIAPPNSPYCSENHIDKYAFIGKMLGYKNQAVKQHLFRKLDAEQGISWGNSPGNSNRLFLAQDTSYDNDRPC